jgi:hypothetical protein
MLAVLSWGAVGVASAQVPIDKPVYFTFSQPVALPQVTLPAGKYLFRLADSNADRRIIQIYAADGSKLYGMMMVRHAYRPEPADEPEIRFLETPADTPQAIATYWYPGTDMGYEFIYPPDQAARLAQTSNQSVLTTDKPASTPEDMMSAGVVRVSPSGERTPVSDDAKEGEATAAGGRTQAGEVAIDAPTTYAEPDEASTSSSPNQDRSNADENKADESKADADENQPSSDRE